MATEFIKIMEGVTMTVTLFMFTTGFPPIIHMYKTKDTRNVPFHMFMMGAIGCLSMFHYGLMMQNGTIVFLNAVGSFLQCTYVCVFLLLAPYKMRSLQILAVGILYMTGLYYYLYIVTSDPDKRQDILGMMSSLVTTLMLCLPAVEVIGNIRNKNAYGMPTVMLLGGLICSSCWLLYGILLHDPNIYVPNIPGLVITLVKLHIIRLYSGGSKMKQS